jgi:tRNA acetyltransferase TAN1
MTFKKRNNKEVLLQFKQTPNPKELDEMIYQFEKEMNKNNYDYFLKESENPFIFFIELSKPEELIKQLRFKEEYTVTPVTCVISNINYITSVVLRKIRHKISFNDTFKINCYSNTYCTIETSENIANELTDRIEDIIKIEKTNDDPVWTIDLYIVGDITAINITKTNKQLTDIWT